MFIAKYTSVKILYVSTPLYLTYKPIHIKGLSDLLHHADRKVKVCNIFNDVLHSVDQGL